MTAKLKLAPPVPVPAGDESGGMFISTEQLTRFGGGDAKKGRRYLRLLLADERPHEPPSGPTERPSNVRWAYGNEDDERRIVDLIELDCKREAPDGTLISRERIRETVAQGTHGKMGVTGVIDHPKGRAHGIVGCVVLFPVQPLFSETRYVHEAFHIVHPDHRRSRYAENLLDFAKWVTDEWSREWGHRINLIYTVHARLEGFEKIRFFRRHMQQIGGTFSYPPIGGN